MAVNRVAALWSVPRSSITVPTATVRSTMYRVPILFAPVGFTHTVSLILPATLWREVITVPFYTRGNRGFKEMMSFSPGQSICARAGIQAGDYVAHGWGHHLPSVASHACRMPVLNAQFSVIPRTSRPDQNPDPEKHVWACTCVCPCMHLCRRRRLTLGNLARPMS